MNIIKVENVKGIENRAKGMTVLHDYKMDGRHVQSVIVVLSYDDLKSISNIIEKLRGYNVSCLVMPEALHFTPEERILLEPLFNKSFTVSYY
jgi:hypothetical protein